MLKIGAILFIVLDFSSLISSENEFPKFIKIPEDVEVTESFKSDLTPASKWYAAWPTDYRVILMGHTSFSMTLHCTVDTLSKENQITEMKFCFTKTAGGERCETLTAGRIDGNFGGFWGTSKITVSLNMNVLTGGIAKLEATDDVDVSSTFYCVASNRRGTVKSNKIIIQDFRRLFPSGLQSNTQTNVLYTDGPTTFNCWPISVPKDVELTYVWYYCSNSRFERCAPPRLVQFSNNWPRQIFKNGSLFFPFIPLETQRIFEGKFVYCGINNVPTTFYNRPISFKTGSPNPVKGLQITYPPVNANYKLLNSRNTRKTINCNFIGAEGEYQIVWKKVNADGTSVQLSDAISSKYKVTMIGEKSAVIFEGPFTKETEGKYICEIQWTPKGETSKIVKSRQFSVSVEYFPRVKSLVPKIFVVSGNNGSFTCQFERNSVTASLAINGKSINLESKKDLEASVSKVNSAMASFMAALKVTVTPLNPKPGESIVYTAYDMVNKSLMNSKSSTHQVDCIGTNTVGKVRGTVLLQVIPKLVLGATPSSTNCSSCSAKEAHEFKCVISNIEDYNVTSRKVIVSQYWKLGKTPVAVPKSHSFLALSDDNSTLTIKKIDDAKLKDYINENGKVTCVIKLSYPKEMAMAVPVFYSTEEDPELSSKLSTSIQLMDIAPKPKAASLNWAIVLGLAILVVLIIVVLVFAMCRRHRKPGETYDVDHTEKKQGNDPEAENHEKEAFPVYERPEDGPIRGSRASLDDSIHVGSDDEDEDLAEYDVDIGKFNEEGSFIGQYAVNDSHGGQPNNSRKLPNVSSNTDV